MGAQEVAIEANGDEGEEELQCVVSYMSEYSL